MATIKEIAALAGVSRGTVDRVLNHRGDVNPQTEEKIMKIVRALDYKPNKAGIVLAAQKKNLKLGVILLGVGNPFFDDVLAGVNEKAQELAGYNCSVLIRQTEYSLQQQLDAIDGLLSEGINGLAISPYNDSAVREKIDVLNRQGIPVVTLNTDIENAGRLAYVGSNFYRSGEPPGPDAPDDKGRSARRHRLRLPEHPLPHRAHCRFLPHNRISPQYPYRGHRQ